MKVIVFLLLVCLAVSSFAQLVPGAGAGAGAGRANMLAAMMAGRGGAGGNNMLTYGALSGAMGDRMQDMARCRLFGINPMFCMSGMLGA